MNRISKLLLILFMLIIFCPLSYSQEKQYRGNINNIFTTSLAILSSEYEINEINYKEGRVLFMANGSLYELETMKKDSNVAVKIDKIKGSANDPNTAIPNIYQKLSNKYGN